MAPVALEGENLGQRHRYYNKLLQTALADKEAELTPLNYDDPDVDNLLRIDVACSRRDVDYVLAVLQSDDMLYVSRAIKRSTWLITDDQYAHIINPQHLYNELFPKMTAKAQNKLILAIRLNLKNESRVEEFFHYYKDDIKVAQKWLSYCSLAVKEKTYTDYKFDDLTSKTFKLQCENSDDPIRILKVLLKVRRWEFVHSKLVYSKVLIDKYPQQYMDIILTLEHYETFQFGARATKRIMQKCPDKLTNNFHKLYSFIHLPTFAKCLGKDQIESFLIKQATNEKMKHWIKYDNIKYFVKYIPVQNRFNFVKTLFINKEVPSKATVHSEIQERTKDGVPNIQTVFSGYGKSLNNAHIYRWYHCAPFDVAFTALKKLIRVESSPAERNAMLIVLVNCAHKNPQQAQTLLKFYREKHINEPFNNKVHFINTLLSMVDIHKFNSDTWDILKDIFSSLDVFVESENSVPQCVKAVIAYKVLHNQNIPDIIQKKYTFDTFEDYRKKLDDEEQGKLFAYLFNREMDKLNTTTTNNEVEMTSTIEQLNNVLNLLKEWKKNIAEYPLVLEKIRHIIKVKKEHSMKSNLSQIFNLEKKWRRQLFEESLALAPNDKACVHALKHDPGLFLRHSGNVEEMRVNDTISLKHTLNKLRIYWAQTLAEKWTDSYLAALDKPTGHKATTEGISILLPRQRFLSILKKYAPTETKIDWSNTDSSLFKLQKNLCKQLKLVRPSIGIDAVLSYAKDDYLQFVLPSLNAIMHNMSATEVSEHIPLLFNTPVSLKKRSLHLAYSKLNFSEIKDLVENMWKDTSNSSIKTMLFKETFKTLKKEQKELAIQDLWELLSIFIDNLTSDDNRTIYNTLGGAASVPLAVRPQLFMKSYKYLKSLPVHANCESILERLDHHAPEIIELLEPDFVEEFLLMPVDEFVSFFTGKTVHNSQQYFPMKREILASYIINTKNEEAQLVKYEKYVVPILNSCFKSWKTTKDGSFILRQNCYMLLWNLLNKIKPWFLKTSTINVQIFKDIESKLRTGIRIEENYKIITFWSLGVLFVESLHSYFKGIDESTVKAQVPEEFLYSQKGKTEKIKDEKWNEICVNVWPRFGNSCLNFIKQDLLSQTNSLLSLFVYSLKETLDQIDVQYIPRLQLLKHIMDNNFTLSYLVALEVLKLSYYYDRDEDKHTLRREIIKEIKSHPAMEVKIHYSETVYCDQQLEKIVNDENENGETEEE